MREWVVMLLAGLDLARHLGESLQWRPVLVLDKGCRLLRTLRGQVRVQRRLLGGVRGCGCGSCRVTKTRRLRLCLSSTIDSVQCQTGIDPLGFGDCGTSFRYVQGQRLEATLGEVLATVAAAVLVAVRVVGKLGATVEVLGDDGVLLPSHLLDASGLEGGLGDPRALTLLSTFRLVIALGCTFAG